MLMLHSQLDLIAFSCTNTTTTHNCFSHYQPLSVPWAATVLRAVNTKKQNQRSVRCERLFCRVCHKVSSEYEEINKKKSPSRWTPLYFLQVPLWRRQFFLVCFFSSSIFRCKSIMLRKHGWEITSLFFLHCVSGTVGRGTVQSFTLHWCSCLVNEK